MRLTRNRDIRALFQSGRRINGRHFTVIYQPNQHSHPRFCVQVSRRTARRAVDRNRIRRRLREAFRAQLAESSAGVDLVVVARGSARDLPWPELCACSEKLVDQALS